MSGNGIIAFLGIVVGFISVIISVGSLYLAYRSIRSAVVLNDGMEKTLSDLNNIYAQLSTKMIGPFPNHISEIVKNIENSNKSILIAGIAGYGATTDRDYYTEYEGALKKKGANGVDVQILIPTKELMKKSRESEFSNIEARLKDELFKSKFYNAFLRHGYDDESISLDKSSIFSILDKDEDSAISALSGSSDTNIIRIDSVFPMHFWIFDESAAIFALRTFKSEKYTYAFYTKDVSIVNTLISSWEFLSEQMAE